MKKVLRALALFSLIVSAAAQPTIPVSNLSPVTGNSIIGRDGATGRAQVIPLGAGLSFSGGALTVTGGGGGGAPINATFITQTPNATLTNEQALSALSSGLMFVTTTTGVITSLGSTLPAANGGFGTNISGSSGVPLFSAGVPVFTGTSGTGNFARVGAPTFTGNVTMSGNLAVAGNITVGNMTTTNLTITGSITGVMGAANGGTGQSTYTKGDILAAAAATTLNKLAVGANGLVLTANSTATNGVSWEAASGGTVTASGPPGAGQAAMWTSATNLQGVTVTGTGAPVLGTSPSFTTNLTLANGASPSTAAVAATAFDTDAWAASRGAVQVHDGTANTYVVGALASDTPSNGQVPTWNTGGTITWESPSAGAGNVTNSGTLTSGNIIMGAGTTVVTVAPGMTYDSATHRIATINSGSSSLFAEWALLGGGTSLPMTSNSTTLYSDVLLLNNASRYLQIMRTGSAYASSVITNGPASGEASVIKTSGTQPLLFGTNDTMAIQINGDQEVNIGSITDAGSYKFQVTGSSIFNSGTARFSIAGTGGPILAVSHANLGYLYWLSIDASNNFELRDNDASTVLLEITTTGKNLVIPSTTASTSTTTGSAQFGGGVGVAGRTSTATLNVGTGTTMNSIFSASASLDFGSILTAAEATLTITVTGVATTNTPSVALGWSAALEDGIVVKQAWVSAADTVSVRVANVSIGSINPAAVTCRATVTSF